MFEILKQRMIKSRVLDSILYSAFLFFCLSSYATQNNTKHTLQYSPLRYELGVCGDNQHDNYYSISAIQGNKFSSPLINRWVITEGVVTLSLQGKYQYKGFWLQQKDASPRSKNSSRGIFVYHDKKSIKSGQSIRLLAQVSEYHSLTEIKKVRAIKVCNSNAYLPKAEKINLPLSSLIELEAKEGMRVTLAQRLVVSDLYGAGYGLGNYGQFAVSSQLHSQPTELYTAEQLRKNKDLLPAKELDYLLIDDASAKVFPKAIAFPMPKGFSADNSVRVSDQVMPLDGILHAYGDNYIIIPENVADVEIISLFPRTKKPKVYKDANLVIASMNLANYFNGKRNNNSQKDSGFPTSRGARSYKGLLLQTEKIVSALAAIDADIIALMEIENDGYGAYSALADLTRVLNKQYSFDQQYKFIKPDISLLADGKLGQDSIAVALLYRPYKVKTKGAAKLLNSKTPLKSLFDDRRNRPSLIQRFEFKQQEFIIAVNHFKSKGRPCPEVELDKLQGNCNIIRYQAALALAETLAQKNNKERALPTLILGDLNSYSQEDPLLALYQAGYKNLKYLPQFLNSSKNNAESLPNFSYSFQGLLGNLDHALGNAELLPLIKSIDSWHINSIEDVLLDYNKEKNGHKYPSIDTYGKADMYRSSDHDPVVIGLQFPATGD